MRLASMLVLMSLTLGACRSGPTTYVTIRHPLQVGGVDPNRVPFDQSREERNRQIPNGSLVDQAELISLSPDQICARITLWADQTEPQRADFNAYRIALLTDQEGVENTGAQISMEQPMVQAYQGVRRQTRYTGGYGVVNTYAESFVWQITTQPATLCWPNGGFVTPSTTRLTLELRNAGSRNRLNFEWEFNSSIAVSQ